MQKKRGYWIGNAVLLLAVLGATAWSIAGDQNFAMLPAAFARMRPGYIAAGGLLGILYVLCESFILKHIFSRERRRVSFASCARYSLIGFFFSAITPSASGGQPVEIYYMKRDGIPVSRSTPMLMLTTLLYKIVLVLSGIVFLVAGRETLAATLAGSVWLFVLGFVTNFLFIAVVLLLFFRPHLVERFMRWLFALRPFQRHTRPREKAIAFAEKYRHTCDFLIGKGKEACVWLSITLFQRMILLFIPYLVYRAFGLSGVSAGRIMLLQGVVAISVDMLPLPGGMGATEYLSKELFTPVFGSELVLPGVLAARALSFYVPLAVSGIATVISHFRARRAGEGALEQEPEDSTDF